jgi:hypothetical protein
MAKFVMERSIEDSYIIDTVKDLLIDSDDEGFECRIWVNDVTHPSHIKYREKLDLISIEIHNKLPMDNDKSNIVYETITLIMNYLKSEGFNWIKLYGFEPGKKELDLDIKRDTFVGYNWVYMDFKKN